MVFLRSIDGPARATAKAELAKYGFCAFREALSDGGHVALREEALSQVEFCTFSQQKEGLAYEAYVSDLGPLAMAYLTSSATLDLLRAMCGRDYQLVQEKSCFTYYFGGGHLAPHLDSIPGEHAVSLLTYLLVDSPAGKDQPSLDIYEKGSMAPGLRQYRLATPVRSIVLGLGAEVWHGRATLVGDEKIVMINGSYRAH